MEKIYERIDWKNEPSEDTPINEDNLNKMDYAIDKLDDRIIEVDGSVTTMGETVSQLVEDVTELEADVIKNIKIGEVRTVDSSTPANVTATTVDNETTLDFDIPKGKDGSGGGSANIEEMTWVEYEALPDTKESDNTMRLIKDKGGSGGGGGSNIAKDIIYDDSKHTIGQTNVQDAIDSVITKTSNKFGTTQYITLGERFDCPSDGVVTVGGKDNVYCRLTVNGKILASFMGKTIGGDTGMFLTYRVNKGDVVYLEGESRAFIPTL